MKQQPILKVADLSKSFGGVHAVNGVGFELQPGETLGIIGPNGSGKSTLINLITGFVKPDSGKVIFRGQDITGAPPFKIVTSGIARSFQMARSFSSMPVYKNLIVPLYSARARKLKGGQYGDRDETAIHLLEEVGFERDSSVPYKLAGSLPHGYVKRLELARCLALDPEIIILDELFSGMSMSEVASILPLLERINEEGKTLIMVEHRLRELFRVVNRAIVLNFGTKIAEGTPEEVVAVQEVRDAYLGSETEDA
ncbi:MAG: ABC transporter ATP-binding protein [Chloroflexi bacterium]|nr:ABC transporter ATP-binding protein [Chloroflexota bacterium]MDA8187760.1 ABC transporter ATP-binding protein [Dehalococcoidales bacterium]